MLIEPLCPFVDILREFLACVLGLYLLWSLYQIIAWLSTSSVSIIPACPHTHRLTSNVRWHIWLLQDGWRTSAGLNGLFYHQLFAIPEHKLLSGTVILLTARQCEHTNHPLSSLSLFCCRFYSGHVFIHSSQIPSDREMSNVLLSEIKYCWYGTSWCTVLDFLLLQGSELDICLRCSLFWFFVSTLLLISLDK